MKIVRAAMLLRKMPTKMHRRVCHVCPHAFPSLISTSTSRTDLFSLITTCLLCQLDISHHQHNIKLNLDKDDKEGKSKPASGGAADGDGGK